MRYRPTWEVVPLPHLPYLPQNGHNIPMTWGWFFLIAIAVAFFYSQVLHNKADSPLVHEEVRKYSRKQGRQTEKIFFALLGIALVLLFIGVIDG
jgi:hypothetical protein